MFEIFLKILSSEVFVLERISSLLGKHRYFLVKYLTTNERTNIRL